MIRRNVSFVMMALWHCALIAVSSAIVVGVIGWALGTLVEVTLGKAFVWRFGAIPNALVAGCLAAQAAWLLSAGTHAVLGVQVPGRQERLFIAGGALFTAVAFDLVADFWASSQTFYFVRLCIVGTLAGSVLGGTLLTVRQVTASKRFLAQQQSRDALFKSFADARLGPAVVHAARDTVPWIKGVLGGVVIFLMAWYSLIPRDDLEVLYAFRPAHADAGDCGQWANLCEVYRAMQALEHSRDSATAERHLPAAIAALHEAAIQSSYCGRTTSFFYEAAKSLDVAATQTRLTPFHAAQVEARDYYEGGITELALCLHKD